MTFRILSSGYRDLAEARDFYERQAPQLGSYFLESLIAEVESLRLYAGIHKKVFGFHPPLAARIPFAIYYKIEAGEAVVYRILDCRQDAKKLRKALR